MTLSANQPAATFTDYALPPYGGVGACLPSVPCLTLSRERKKLKIDKKEVHDTGDP